VNRFLTISFCAVMTVVVTAKAAPPPDLIARIHFAGAEQISADTNSTAFTNFFCSAEAQALREQTLNKLSHFPYTWFKSRLAAGANEGAKQLCPLLDDLLKSEWILEIRDTTNGAPESALAIRLNASRAQLWQENLAGVLQSWTHLPARKTSNGWLLKKDLPPNLVRFVRAGNWVILSCGENELPLSDGIVRRVLAEKRPAPVERNFWLTVDLDWPRLARWFPPLQEFDFPGIELQFIGHDGDLWANGKFTLAQPLPPLEKWRMPTNVIHQPFVSFTMVRGIGSWLERQSWARPFEIQPAPDQFFIWTLPQIPFQTFIATPVENATNAIRELGKNLAVAFNTRLQQLMLGSIQPATNDARIDWRGLPPFVAPFAQAVREPGGDFLLVGLFPYWPDTNPLPPELRLQFSRTDLLYYHWEITAARLPQVLNVCQLALMLAQRQQLDVRSAAGKWLHRIGPTLGSTVTEITQTAPNELSFRRKSRGGLTAVELVALANWLEGTNFPGCDLRLPPQMDGATAALAPALSAFPN